MLGDPGDSKEGEPQNQHQQQYVQPHKQIVQRGMAFMGVEDDRADSPRAGQQGHGDGDDRHRLPAAADGLFPAEGDRTLPGMEHGYGHEQEQDAAGNPERADTDAKKTEQKLTGQQCRYQNHQYRNHRDLGGPSEFFLRGVRRQGNDNGDGADGINDGQQGDKDLGVLRKFDVGLVAKS